MSHILLVQRGMRCSSCAGGAQEAGRKTDRILQGNLNRSRIADILLPQIADEYDTDILILCEPYREQTARTWFMNETRTVVIWVRGAAPFRIIDHGAGEDYVWVRISVITYISYNLPVITYISYNLPDPKLRCGGM